MPTAIILPPTLGMASGRSALTARKLSSRSGHLYGKEGDGISEAHNLFTVLRELDRKGAKTVYARCPLSDGVSMAVYNRLIRAAAFRVVEV